jgi:hypothetical protein
MAMRYGTVPTEAPHMIIRETPVDNAWYRAAGVWFIALSAINCLAWPVADYCKYDLPHLQWLALATPLGSLILGILGKLLGEPRRILLFVMIIGLFGIVPLLAGLLVPIFCLLLLCQENPARSLIFMALCLTPSAYWISVEVEVLRLNMIRERFIEREFRIGKNFLYLNRSPTTDLEGRPAGNGPFLERAGWIFPTLVFLLPIAYPLQRLIFHAGRAPAVVLLLTILGTPLAIYILGRMTRGFYLWIYTVRKLELQHRKPVIFEPTTRRI